MPEFHSTKVMLQTKDGGDTDQGVPMSDYVQGSKERLYRQGEAGVKAAVIPVWHSAARIRESQESISRS